jgi:hypothetical protein
MKYIILQTIRIYEAHFIALLNVRIIAFSVTLINRVRIFLIVAD